MKVSPRLCTMLSITQLLLMTSGADHVHHVRPPSAELTTNTNRTSHQALESLVRDCSDLPYGSSSGVYMILEDLNTPVPAYCDMDDGEGWTVFQKRADILPRQDFLLDWESYKWGLGSLGGEFWWGLHHLWRLTSQLDRIYELRVDLWDWEQQTRHAIYQDFNIASEEDYYRLSFNGYAGDAGDALIYHLGMNFSTIDRDNDVDPSRNCASTYKGAWWYKNCFESNLNGVYSPGTVDGTVVIWTEFRRDYCLNTTTMKIRPTEKLQTIADRKTLKSQNNENIAE